MAMLLDFSRYKHPEQHCFPTTDFDKEVLLFLQQWHKQDRFTIRTSGSTGVPKPIVHTKEAMQQSARLTGSFFNFQKGHSAVLCLPITKIAGIMMLVRAIVWQLKLYTLPPKQKLNLAALPFIDFAPLLPMQALENFSQLHTIKTILLGGALLPTLLKGKLQRLSSCVYHSYGMTETLSHIALCKVNGEGASETFTALPNVALSVDKESRLHISAPQLGIEGLQTHDIVQLLSPTTFVFVGRHDTVINSGGLKLVAEDIERQLSAFISHNFYVKGTADPLWGEKVTLFIEGKSWCRAMIKDLQKQFQNISPKQAIPKEIIFTEKFTYTPTGKLIKK